MEKVILSDVDVPFDVEVSVRDEEKEEEAAPSGEALSEEAPSEEASSGEAPSEETPAGEEKEEADTVELELKGEM
mgnify:CR=1 FL=1